MTKRLRFLLKVFLAIALGICAINLAAVPAQAQAFGGISYGTPTTCPGYPTLVIDQTNNVLYSCGSSGTPVYVGNASTVVIKTLSEGACTGAATGVDVLCADATLHAFKSSLNNGSFVAIPQLAVDLGGTAASPTVTSTHVTGGTVNTVAKFNATGNLVNAPLTDTTGLLATSEPFASDSNTVALTSDWTCGTGGTVSSCAAATIIGSGGGVPMTFTLPLIARSWTLECDGVVGQATAATSNQWNLLTATNGATNVTANYSMATAATASAFGAVTDQASTTSTFQIAPNWTLGGTATKMPFHIYARVEGASVSGTVLSVQLLAPTVADLVTIYRGMTCKIR